MKPLEAEHIVVIGAARSGAGVASLLKRHGYNPFVTDAGPISEQVKQRFQEEGIPFEEGGHTEKAREGELAVVSPGVPTSAAIVQEYLSAGKKVLSEVEVASQFTNARLIAITGSNGKTTVSEWLHDIWTRAGRPHILAGNIGEAFSEGINQLSDEDEAILEVSSFQLDHIDRFQPDVGLLLNVSPDHLDRYNHSFEQYAAAKARLFENQNQQNWLIYCADDVTVQTLIEPLFDSEEAPKLLGFSTSTELDDGAFIRDEQIVLKINNQEETLMPVSNVGLPGNHNLRNGLAAALAARISEIKSEFIRESLRQFEGVEHRMEYVGRINGIGFINDSKATNTNSLWYALDSLKVPGILIMGGRDKGNDYTELRKLVYEKVRGIVAIGESREKIKKQLGGIVPSYIEAESMKEAVTRAFDMAEKGELVLLSPACSSFDMFENYEHRGDVFKKAVQSLEQVMNNAKSDS